MYIELSKTTFLCCWRLKPLVFSQILAVSSCFSHYFPPLWISLSTPFLMSACFKRSDVCLQHGQEVGGEDACDVTAGSTQHCFRLLQMDRVRWWISNQKRGVDHCSGFHWSKSNHREFSLAFCFVFHILNFRVSYASVLMWMF